MKHTVQQAILMSNVQALSAVCGKKKTSDAVYLAVLLQCVHALDSSLIEHTVFHKNFPYTLLNKHAVAPMTIKVMLPNCLT